MVLAHNQQALTGTLIEKVGPMAVGKQREGARKGERGWCRIYSSKAAPSDDFLQLGPPPNSTFSSELIN